MSKLPGLLPCPFCGNNISLVVMDENDVAACDCRSDRPYFTVCCSILEISPNTPNWKAGCGASGAFKPTRAEAIMAWNQRTERWECNVKTAKEA